MIELIGMPCEASQVSALLLNIYTYILHIDNLYSWALPGGTQCLFLALCLEIAPSGLRGTIVYYWGPNPGLLHARQVLYPLYYP